MWVGRWWWWRARRWEGGGGRILDFRRNTNPSHLPLTSTRNWPKSLSIFSNHVKRKTPWLEIGRGKRGGLVHGGEGWPALDYFLSLHCSADTPPANSASLVYCSTCCWRSACRHFREFYSRQIIMYKEQCGNARTPECRQPGKWASYQNIVHCIWAGWALQGARGQVLEQHK